MRRHLHEAKADLELAIVKSLDRAPLTVTELQEIESLTVRDLMSDHDLDYILAERVLSHAKNESLRLQAQNLQTRIPDLETSYTSLTRSNPIDQKPENLSEGTLRKIIRRIVNEELSG